MPTNQGSGCDSFNSSLVVCDQSFQNLVCPYSTACVNSVHIYWVCVEWSAIDFGCHGNIFLSLSLCLCPLTDSSQPSLAQPSLTLQSFPYGGCESVELSYQSGMCIELGLAICLAS